ncbi:hypothetical protein GcM3_012021 [Golovinomyces cichoracearum]|uniref:Uncharacterized protein n=1 Tax=Golovinomyces cichoracearum TaxID=62708 RepID=A0A420J9N4_9PEZI|nr:hypothetical protein GcM3_012021 [Golovinomyces cichoracearum]
MSSSAPSSLEPTTILAVNKKLKDALGDIDLCFNKVEEHFDSMEKCLKTILTKLENMDQNITMVDIPKKDKGKGKANQPKAVEVEELQKQKPANISKSENHRPQQRNAFGRIHTLTQSDKRDELIPVEAFVKRAWPEAIFPEDIDDAAYTSVKNKVVLKPEWKLIEAGSDVFTKLSIIQTALQMNLVPYHLWGYRVAAEMDGDFLNVRVWAAGRQPG